MLDYYLDGVQESNDFQFSLIDWNDALDAELATRLAALFHNFYPDIVVGGDLVCLLDFCL